MSATYIPVMAKLFARLTRADLNDYRQMVESAGDDLPADELYARCQSWLQAHIPDLAEIVI